MKYTFSIPIDKVNDFKVLIKSEELNSLRLEGNPIYIGEKALFTVSLNVEQSDKLNLFLNEIYENEQKLEVSDNSSLFSKLKNLVHTFFKKNI